MSADSPETYMRCFAEAQLRRLAASETADCASRMDAVAAAFEGTGVLEGERAQAIADDFYVAMAARSPERGTLLHDRRRGQISALRGPLGFARIFARAAQMRARGAGGADPEDAPWDVCVVPAGAVLRLRENEADEDIYLLSYAAAPGGRAWLSVAARTTQARVPRRHASPPSGRNAGARPPRPPTFAGSGLAAVDDAGRKYDLHFSGGGGRWFLGRLSVHPAPPPGIAWLEVRCGGQSVRLDLTAKGPNAEVTVRSVAGSAGEAYLLRRAEGLLSSSRTGAGLARLAATEVTGLASAVPALRAIGMLPDDSPVPGQLAALAERMGAPGRLTSEPAEMPERWASVLAPGGPAADAETGSADGADAVAAAHLAVVLPEAGGVAVQLAGLVTLPGEGTVIFGGLRARPGQAGGAVGAGWPGKHSWGNTADGHGEQSMWLRDDRGGWHNVSISGWASNGNSYTFQAAVVPPVGPDTSRVEFYVTGGTTEVRAVIPLTWWTS